MLSWFIVAAYIIAVFWFATLQQSSAGEMQGLLFELLPHLSHAQVQELVILFRKSGHVFAYFVLALLLFWASRSTIWFKKHSLWWAGFFAMIVASLDELNQVRLAHRTGAWQDVLIDGIGVTLALGIIAVVRSRKRSKTAKLVREGEDK